MFLLRFLRERKFNVDEAFRLLEKSFLALARLPRFCDFTEDFGMVEQMFAAGCCYPLMERDEQGRRIILIQNDRVDPDTFTAYNGMKLLSYVLNVLLEEEETQIAGCVFITNLSNVSIRHSLTVTPADCLEIVKLMQNFPADVRRVITSSIFHLF